MAPTSFRKRLVDTRRVATWEPCTSTWSGVRVERCRSSACGGTTSARSYGRVSTEDDLN